MPFVERGDGVSLFWQEWGDGPGLLMTHSYIQHPKLLEGLIAAIERGHRMVRYDARGTGESTRRGPYDMRTDVDDLLAVAEAAGPLTAVIANGDATNRAVHAAAERPDLIPYVISLETVPLVPGQADGTDALVSSGEVLEALVGMMRTDYRAGVSAAVQRGNPLMTQNEVRERVDASVAYIDHDAACVRLEEWIADDPGDDPAALRDRLVVAYEGASAWFPAELIDRARAIFPEAQFMKLDGGSISRPDMTAAVIRGVTGAAART